LADSRSQKQSHENNTKKERFVHYDAIRNAPSANANGTLDFKDTAMKTLVLLPGLDGTGTLFTPLLEALGQGCPSKIIWYPANEPLDYEALVERVRKELPQSGDFVLVEESFSGPIAIRLAAENPPGLRGVVLCGSFVKNPYSNLFFLRPLSCFFPTKGAFVFSVLSRFLLGRFATPALESALRRAAIAVSAMVLRLRIREILSVDVTKFLARITVPLLYLQATRDRVVPCRAAKNVQQFYPTASVVSVEAPHLLFQVVPDVAAKILLDFLSVGLRISG
jgi:pimeloyl-ACP methyl ester carboxylesterase